MPIYYLDSGSIDNLEISSSLLVSGSFALSGSLRISEGGITGSLLGTSSWSQNSVTASFVTTAQTASFVTTAQTASYVLQAVSSSFATTASFAVSASWAPGGGSVGGSGTANRVTKFTAATTLGDSNIFDNGSNIQITSSNIVVSGSDTFVAFTSSFFGIYQTASQYNGNVELQVKNASVGDVNAQSIVNVLGDSNTGLSIGTNTSGYVPLPGSDNLADAKDSFVSNNTQGGVLHIYNTSTGSTSAVWIYSQPDAFPLSPKVVIQVTGSEAFIDTLVATGSLFGTSSWAQSASYVLQAVSASFATTASFALNATSTPAFPFTGSAEISGSLRIIGSGSNIFVVSGSLGSLLNVSEKTAADTRLFTVSSASINLLTVNDDKSTRISGSLIVTGSITGSLLGSASFATTSSYAITASFALNAGGGSGTGFPFEGVAIITGSIAISSGSGIFAPTVTASESLTAGDFINIAAGGVRKASSDNTGKQAHGFVTQSVAANASVVVFYGGLNTNVSGLTAGSRYFLGTSGGETLTPPTTAGQLSQEVGVAVSSTAILVNFGPAIVT